MANGYNLAVARPIFDTFVAGGLTPAQAAGFLGNFQEESTLNPRAFNAGEGATGLGQWRLDRAANLRNFAAQNGADLWDPTTQAKFALHEMRTQYPRQWTQLTAAQTPQDAATAVIGWERPGGYNVKTGDATGVPSYGDRLSHAANIFGALTGSSAPAPQPSLASLAAGQVQPPRQMVLPPEAGGPPATAPASPQPTSALFASDPTPQPIAQVGARPQARSGPDPRQAQAAMFAAANSSLARLFA